MSWEAIRTRRWLLFLVGVFCVALAMRVYRLGELGSWEDETKEAMDVVRATEHDGRLSGAMVRHVQRFGQPPLSYYLQQAAVSNVGLTLAGIRAHSALAGALMTVGVALLWMRMRPPDSRVWPWTFGLLAIPACAPLYVYYGQEARPYSTGLLMSVLWLIALYEFVFRGSGRVRVSAVVFLTAVQLAFLLSLGFQPAVVLFTAGLALVSLVFAGVYRRRVLWAWLTTLVALLAFLPWQTLPLYRYRFHLKGGSSGGLGGVLAPLFGEPATVPSGPWIEKFYRDAIGLRAGVPDAGLLVAALLAAAVLAYTWRRRDRDRAAWVLFLLLFSAAFPFTYAWIRGSLIEAPDHVRYSITAMPPVFLLGIALGATGLEWVAGFTERRGGRPWLAPAIAGLLSVSLLVLSVRTTASVAYRHRGPDRRMHKILARGSMPGDLYYSPDYRLRQAFHFYDHGPVDEVKPLADLPGDLAGGLIGAETRRIFVSHFKAERFDRSGLARLSATHEAIGVVFDHSALRCLVITAGPGGMLATLRPIFDEWEGWMEERYPEHDGPAYVGEGARILRLLEPGPTEGDETGG